MPTATPTLYVSMPIACFWSSVGVGVVSEDSGMFAQLNAPAIEYRVTGDSSTAHMLENWGISAVGYCQYLMICAPTVATQPHT